MYREHAITTISGVLMSEMFYPKINESDLRVIKKMVASVPGYLENAACPYSQEIKDLFKPADAVLKSKNTNLAPETLAEIEVDLETLSDEGLMEEINALYNQLKASGRSIGKMDDSTEASAKNTYFRLMMNLMKEVVSLRERLQNKINISKFTEGVLTAMEEILDADQRNIFIERMKKLND